MLSKELWSFSFLASTLTNVAENKCITSKDGSANCVNYSTNKLNRLIFIFVRINELYVKDFYECMIKAFICSELFTL